MEKSVDVLRNQIFADTWSFNSLEDAQEYAHSRLLKMNENSQMEEEKKHLRPYRPPLELAILSEAKVNPSSLISVDTVFYSVPEYLVGKRVVVKKYHNEIRVYAGNELAAKHKRLFGNGIAVPLGMGVWICEDFFIPARTEAQKYLRMSSILDTAEVEKDWKDKRKCQVELL